MRPWTLWPGGTRIDREAQVCKGSASDRAIPGRGAHGRYGHRTQHPAYRHGSAASSSQAGGGRPGGGVARTQLGCLSGTAALLARRRPSGHTEESDINVFGADQHRRYLDHQQADQPRWRPPGEVTFRPANTLEDPPQDLQAAIKAVEERRKQSSKGWRGDGSWGSLNDQEDL